VVVKRALGSKVFWLNSLAVWSFIRHVGIKKPVYGLKTIFFYGGLVSLLIVIGPGSPALALSQDQTNVLSQGIYYFNTEVGNCSTSATSTTTNLVGTDNITKAFNYFMAKGGLSAIQVAGLLGNLYAESNGINPNNSEDGKQDPTPIPGVGFGIAQWTTAGRQQGLTNLAASEGVQPIDLGVQLDYVWQELNNGYLSALQALESASDLQTATNIIMYNYEIPAVVVNGTAAQQQQELQDRVNDATAILALYGASAQSGSTTTSTVTTTSSNDCGSSPSSTGASCNFSSGGTFFTTNSNSATTSVGEISIAQMCQRAQLLAAGQLINPASATNQPYCSNGACAGLCETVAGIVWGYYPPGYDCAYSQWLAMVATGQAHPGDKNPPVGALLFFVDQYSPNLNLALTNCNDLINGTLETNYGHVVVYLGDNMVISPDWPNSGDISIVPITDMTGNSKGGWNEPYLGWSNPVFAGSLVSDN